MMSRIGVYFIKHVSCCVLRRIFNSVTCNAEVWLQGGQDLRRHGHPPNLIRTPQNCKEIVNKLAFVPSPRIALPALAEGPGAERRVAPANDESPTSHRSQILTAVADYDRRRTGKLHGVGRSFEISQSSCERQALQS